MRPNIEADPQMKEDRKKKDKSSLLGDEQIRKDPQEAKKYYTLSKKGITTYVGNDPVEYITLNDWIHEREHYRLIKQKRFFASFRRWKYIRMWRRKIMESNRAKAQAALTDKLFILDDYLGNVLMDHR